MGGIGSGNYYRWNSSTTKTEEVHRVDIRFQTYDDAIHLIYKHRRHGEDWKQENERIVFDWTACNYGGNRQWFKCPHCSKRVGVLYGLDSGFLCRHCYDLSYSSQSEGRLDGLIRKARNISNKIENERGYFEKPKGMHWKTYNRLVKQECDISDHVDRSINRLLSTKLVGKLR